MKDDEAEDRVRDPAREERTRAHVRAVGHVQGVGFRYETRKRARSLGVSGWVRNRSDGSVEAVFEGARERVESMLEWCRRGPGWARPEDVQVERQQPLGETTFEIR
ncbi:MAG: acylphosphatase [Gaiellaceae bacterium]